MRTVLIAAVIGGVVGALLCALVGADFNAGLARFGTKQQAAIEGALLWAGTGLLVGSLLGAAVGGIVKAVRSNRPARL
jgi:hypothetical protein